MDDEQTSPTQAYFSEEDVDGVYGRLDGHQSDSRKRSSRGARRFVLRRQARSLGASTMAPSRIARNPIPNLFPSRTHVPTIPSCAAHSQSVRPVPQDKVKVRALEPGRRQRAVQDVYREQHAYVPAAKPSARVLTCCAGRMYLLGSVDLRAPRTSVPSSSPHSGPSYKRGPPKGYIHAIEQRWHHVEAVLGAILSARDPRAQALVADLRRDELAREILSRVDVGPFVRPRARAVRLWR
jgi:hypothetical protein